jgi:hypothetical protein
MTALLPEERPLSVGLQYLLDQMQNRWVGYPLDHLL